MCFPSPLGHFATAYNAKGMETLDDTKGFVSVEQCAFMATTADESIVSLHKLVKLPHKAFTGATQWGILTTHQIPSILEQSNLKLDLFNAQYIKEIVEKSKDENPLQSNLEEMVICT